MIGWTGLIAAGCHAPSALPPAAPDSQFAENSWVTSDDGLLALRLSAKSHHVTPQQDIQVVAAIRNLSQQQVTVLRPFGDWYAAKAVGMKIWDAKQQIRYTGANATYVVGSDAFAIVAPGETIEDQLALSTDNFAGLEPAGRYRLRFDYSYQGQWDLTAAAGDSGIRNAWRGTISSREVEVFRE